MRSDEANVLALFGMANHSLHNSWAELGDIGVHPHHVRFIYETAKHEVVPQRRQTSTPLVLHFRLALVLLRNLWLVILLVEYRDAGKRVGTGGSLDGFKFRV